MLSNEESSAAKTVEDQFLSSLILVGKTMGEMSIDLCKELNKMTPIFNFKTEGLFLLKEMLLSGELVREIDLKDPSFTAALLNNSPKYSRFQQKSFLQDYCILCFQLFSATRVFTKLLKVPIFLLRKLSMRSNIYLEGNALDCNLSGGTSNSTGYVNISPSKLLRVLFYAQKLH